MIRALVLLLAASACTAATSRPPAAADVADWKRVATRQDADRVSRWRTAFVAALADARKSGHGGEIAREGALLEPDAALGGPGPPQGNYRCRTIKLGAGSPGMLSYIAYPSFACTIEQQGRVLALTKLTGSQRPVGRIYPGEGPRRIFLGTMVLGDETRPLAYGRDRERDMAGAVERVGPNRWRLILPYPRFESIMDVIELVPAARPSSGGAG